jgi:uncharacterized membrane protein
MLPGAVVTLLTTAYDPTVMITFQYGAYLIALIFPATALALEGMGAHGWIRRTAALGAVAAGTILTTSAWGAIPTRAHFVAGFSEVDFRPISDVERRKGDDLRALAAMVPPDASVAVSESELPHVSDREKCFDLRDDTFGADFLLYEKASGWMGADHAQAALGRGEYVQIAQRGSIVLLKRVARP